MSSRDVSMRGFSARTEVVAVWELLDRRLHRLGEEPVPLLEAAGRVLARDAVAAVDVPGFDRAAMDGYAVLANRTYGAAPDDPRLFRIAGESLPARPADVAVRPETCVRIMTGAPMPQGADAVVAVEQTAREGDTVSVTAPVTPGKNVGAVGEDVCKGTTVLKAGRRLRPQDLGVLSSLGFRTVAVVRRPRVAVVASGNELLPPGTMPQATSIADANSPMLNALVARDGGTVTLRPIVPDDRDAVRSAMREAAGGHDVVLWSGGSSVGAEDHAPTILEEEGELAVHGVAMRPSSPAGLGFLGAAALFLLPGNPVSCLCAYDFFAGRAIRILGGRPRGFPHIALRLPLARKIASALGRTDYVRVRIEEDRVVPLAIRGAGILTSTTRAHGFVVVPQQLEGYAENTPVTVYLY